MPKISEQCNIFRRGGHWYFSLTAESGLPSDVWREWRRKAFRSLPDDLAEMRFPENEVQSKRFCRSLIDWLKEQGGKHGETSSKPLIRWLLDFWTAESDYAKHKALVEKAPLSAAYIAGCKRNIELYTASYPPFENLTVGGLSKKLIKPWLVWLAEKGLSGRKINQVRQAVQVPVHDAWKNEEIPAYPFLGVEKAYHEAKERGILTPAEVERIETAPCNDPFRRLAVLLAARCGLRMGEIRGLQWGDIKDGIITVQHNFVDGDGLKWPKTRGGIIRRKTRKALVTATVEAALEAVRRKAKYVDPDDFIIESLRRRGEVVSAGYCKHAFARELETIGITAAERKRRNLVFHGLRHTFVTLGRLAGLTDAEIQALAGHSDGRMMENYSHAGEALDFVVLKAKLEGRTDAKKQIRAV